MNLFRRAFAAVRQSLSLTSTTGWRSSADGSYAGEIVTADTALSISAVWACVNLLSGTIGSLPVMVYRTARDGTRALAKDHWSYRLLHDSPNADQTALDFWEYMNAALELRGNALARKVRIGGRIVSLDPINPADVSVTREPNGDIRYRWSESGTSYDLTQDDVLHIRGFCGSPLGGLSTLTYARNMFGLATAIDRASGSMFRNGMNPGGALTFEKWLTDQQREIAEAKLKEKYVGAMKTGMPIVLEGNTKWQPITITPEDAQMLGSRQFSVEEICRWFGIPPHMVGQTTNSTSWGTGLEQQVLGFQKFTLRRRLRRIEQALMKQLLTPQDIALGIVIEFSLEGLLRGDSAARSAFYQSALANGWMTINEVRALENMPPVDGGDVPRMQSQNVPITSTMIGHNGGPPLEQNP